MAEHFSIQVTPELNSHCLKNRREGGRRGGERKKKLDGIGG